ncbi:uncharacterized protein [Nicotiana sylvestris]|uniref:uncharacterized protein n=1 Tax=Nicotiana sylvestris TaxID=4096 RepID=UPI00388C99B1
MAALPNFEEGQSTYRPPKFNGQYYDWWKTRMHDFIMAEDSELWDIICDGLHVPMKKIEETGPMVSKDIKEYSDINRKAIEKNYRAKKILEALQTAHEGTTQVKQSKIDILTTEYELFRMKDDESIPDMHTRFTSIINGLHSLRDVIPINKIVRKILNVLPGSWESKEIKRKKDSERRDPKNEKNLVLKAESSDSSDEDSDMAYLTKRFQKMVRRNSGIPKRGSSSKAANNDLCHRCGKPGHFIKDCPLVKQEQYKQNPDKAAKRNLHAIAAWGDSSSESKREPDAENSSMMAVETEATKYDSLFVLMAQSDEDEEDEDDEEILTIKLGEAEQSKDDLVVCVVDLNETIANLEKEKEALNEKITSIENERDDLMWTWSSNAVTAMYLNNSGNRCMIRSLLNKIHYELPNGRKPRTTYLRIFLNENAMISITRRTILGSLMQKAMKESFWDTLHEAKATKSTTKEHTGGMKCSCAIQRDTFF